MSAHQFVATLYLHDHGFEYPTAPAVPPLDVAERDLAAIAIATEELATALGLDCGVTIGRALLPHARGMVEIRERLTALRSAVALACVECGVPDKHLTPNEGQIAALFVRARRRAAQVT